MAKLSCSHFLPPKNSVVFADLTLVLVRVLLAVTNVTSMVVSLGLVTRIAPVSGGLVTA